MIRAHFLLLVSPGARNLPESLYSRGYSQLHLLGIEGHNRNAELLG